MHGVHRNRCRDHVCRVGLSTISSKATTSSRDAIAAMRTGNWAANTGNGYDGGLQISQATDSTG